MGLIDFFKGNKDEPLKAQKRDFMSNPIFQHEKESVYYECDEIPNSYGKFGLDETNPIPVNGIIGEAVYLNRLISSNGYKFLYHRKGHVKPSNSKYPIDVFEVLSIDGKEKYKLYFSLYHPRRSLKVPEGLHLIPWKKINSEARIMFKFHCFGTNKYVPDFPNGLPEFIERSKRLNSFSNGIGSVFARHIREYLSKMTIDQKHLSKTLKYSGSNAKIILKWFIKLSNIFEGETGSFEKLGANTDSARFEIITYLSFIFDFLASNKKHSEYARKQVGVEVVRYFSNIFKENIKDVYNSRLFDYSSVVNSQIKKGKSDEIFGEVWNKFIFFFNSFSKNKIPHTKSPLIIKGALEMLVSSSKLTDAYFKIINRFESLKNLFEECNDITKCSPENLVNLLEGNVSDEVRDNIRKNEYVEEEITAKYCIINVDDDKASAEIIDSYIRRALKVRSNMFTSSAEVIAYCSANPDKVDIIITNGMMPGMGGLELLKELDGIFEKRVFAVLHSGHLKDDYEAIDKFYNLNLKNIQPLRFFPKPIPMKQLLETIKSVLDKITKNGN